MIDSKCNILDIAPDAIPINGWDWYLQKATFNLNHWFKKVKKKKIKRRKK